MIPNVKYLSFHLTPSLHTFVIIDVTYENETQKPKKNTSGGEGVWGARVPPVLRACKLRKEDDNNKATLAANCDFKNVDSSAPS